MGSDDIHKQGYRYDDEDLEDVADETEASEDEAPEEESDSDD